MDFCAQCDFLTPPTGILPRALGHLFDKLASQKNIQSFAVKASFIELYNEEFYDLLKPPAQVIKTDELGWKKVTEKPDRVEKREKNANITSALNLTFVASSTHVVCSSRGSRSNDSIWRVRI